ncbi:MAG: rhodanese-like domain-containing protein [Acidobacteria bacterium]|nr:rhodanese-like domain-containing protein [Acidobacteriota bacterium]
MTEIRRNRQPSQAATRRSRFIPVVAAAAILTLSAACATETTGAAAAGEPWGTNTVMPADFAKELAAAAGPDKPVVVCTAPAFLYRVAHIPGAVLHGPASDPLGLSSLTAWAQTLPRSTNLVIYCGCCPLRDCPNLRPAYTALNGLGFTKVRVLILPDSFRADWIERGYPIEKEGRAESLSR